MTWLVPKALQQEEIAGPECLSDSIENMMAEAEPILLPGVNGEKEEEERDNDKSHHASLQYNLA